jgi:hypothetical protein
MRMRVAVVVMMLVAPAVTAQPIFNAAFVEFPPPWLDRIYQSQAGYPEKEACFRSLWQQELRAMRKIGITTVIIQHTLSDDDMYFDGQCAAGACADQAITASQTDVIRFSLETILDEAQRTGMTVWVGLRYRNRWNNGKWPDLIQNESARFVRENVAVANAIERSLGARAAAIAGWYIPQEIDNRTPVVDAKRVLSELTAKLDKPVLISAFWRPGGDNYDEDRFIAMLETSVRGSGFEAVLFQDGVGVANLTESSKTAIADVGRRYKRVADALGDRTKLWPVLEVDRCEGCDQPTTLARLRLQAKAAGGRTPRVAYEFTDLLSPIGAKAVDRPDVLALYSQLAQADAVVLCP